MQKNIDQKALKRQLWVRDSNELQLWWPLQAAVAVNAALGGAGWYPVAPDGNVEIAMSVAGNTFGKVE
jgi:hypothetical protein